MGRREIIRQESIFLSFASGVGKRRKIERIQTFGNIQKELTKIPRKGGLVFGVSWE